MTKPKPPAAPKLGTEGQRLHDAITRWAPNEDGRTFVMRPDELATLMTACRAADRLTELQLVADGLPVIINNAAGSAVISPVITEIRLTEKHLAQLLKSLGVPDGAEAVGGWDGLTASQRARKQAMIRWAK